jgi:hypothetical protein
MGALRPRRRPRWSSCASHKCPITPITPIPDQCPITPIITTRRAQELGGNVVPTLQRGKALLAKMTVTRESLLHMQYAVSVTFSPRD